ncbi:MAG: hypothetical protein DCC65_15215 [Planctomycetota bacterium]|nr:MAG: hypothetical protein DCC65_15215 [Planctomycetota bacterium]
MRRGRPLHQSTRSSERWAPRRRSSPRFHAVLVLPFVAGCTELPLHAKQEVSQAQEDYLDRKLPAARARLDNVLNTFGDYTGAAEAYYLRAKINAETSNKSAALRDAQRCIELSQDRELTSKAHAMAGTLQFETGATAAAIPHLEAALTRMPERPPADLIRYRYGVCLQHEGRWSEARREFSTLVQQYPAGDLAERARRMLEWPGDHFAIQCGAFHDRSSAESQISALRHSGLSPRIEPRSRSGKTLQTVLVGQFRTYSAARSALPSVKKVVSGAVIAP